MEEFLSNVKSECDKLNWKYCRAIELLAEGMYREGYSVSEVIIQIEFTANKLTNFSHK